MPTRESSPARGHPQHEVIPTREVIPTCEVIPTREVIPRCEVISTREGIPSVEIIMLTYFTYLLKFSKQAVSYM